MSSLLSDHAYYRVHKIKGHKCNLPCFPNPAAKYIQSGPFIPFRRYFRKMMMISENDPRAKSYARSTDRFKIEETRHLERYYFMIHPYSEFHFYWQTLMTVVHLSVLLLIPVLNLTNVYEDICVWSEMKAKMLIFLLLGLLNIFVSFFIGFYDQTTDTVIMKPKKVAIRYLRTHFFFDVVSTINYNSIGAIFNLYETSRYTRVQYIFRITRLLTVRDYLYGVHLRYSIPNYIYQCAIYGIFISVVTLLLIYFNYVISYFEKRGHVVELDFVNKFLLELAVYTRRFNLVDIYEGNYSELTHIDMYVSLITLHCGKFLEIWMLAYLFQLSVRYLKVRCSYPTLLHEVKTYIRFKELPKRMSRRIENYINFKYQYSELNERTLLNTLCYPLKDEVLFHNCQNLVSKVETFKDLPDSVMLSLAAMLKSEIYLPNDVVVTAGEVGTEMFFIYTGVLAVFTETGREICHLSDGSYFGEIALLLNEPRVASVVAIDICKLYRLTKKDFNYVIEQYPKIKAKILKAADERTRLTRTILKQQ